MKKEHQHAQVLRWIADGETLQTVRQGGGWETISSDRALEDVATTNGVLAIRIKPKTIRIGDREIEAPVMSGPGYYITDHGDAFRWFGEATLDPGANLQKLGRIYATEEAARAAQEAITALLTREPS